MDGLRTLLETHLFDYSGNAYSHRVCVDFYRQIRQEQKFDSFDQLKAQIGRDIEEAKLYFSKEYGEAVDVLAAPDVSTSLSSPPPRRTICRT